jgi:hypothetical protein
VRGQYRVDFRRPISIVVNGADLSIGSMIDRSAVVATRYGEACGMGISNGAFRGFCKSDTQRIAHFRGIVGEMNASTAIILIVGAVPILLVVAVIVLELLTPPHQIDDVGFPWAVMELSAGAAIVGAGLLKWLIDRWPAKRRNQSPYSAVGNNGDKALAHLCHPRESGDPGCMGPRFRGDDDIATMCVAYVPDC